MARLEPLGHHGDIRIDAVLDAAFGTDRRGRTAYIVRRGMAWLTDLSFAAVDEGDGRLLGLVQSWPVALRDTDGGTDLPLVMVGPVAVLPDQQSAGIGRALMDRLTSAADATSAPPLAMIGDPEYYGRFWAFSGEATGGWRVAGPVEQRRLLARHDGPLPRSGHLGPRRPG